MLAGGGHSATHSSNHAQAVQSKLLEQELTPMAQSIKPRRNYKKIMSPIKHTKNIKLKKQIGSFKHYKMYKLHHKKHQEEF